MFYNEYHYIGIWKKWLTTIRPFLVKIWRLQPLIGGLGLVSLGSDSSDGKILDKTSTPTPETLGNLLTCCRPNFLAEKDYKGIAMSVPGRNRCMITAPYLTSSGFWMSLAHQLPVQKMMPTADQWTAFIQRLKMQPIGQESAVPWLQTSPWSVSLAWQTTEPAEKPRTGRNWFGNMVHYVLKGLGQIDGRKIYQEAAAGNMPLLRSYWAMNQLRITIQAFDRSRSVWEAYQSNPELIQGQKAVDAFVETYEEYTVVHQLSKLAPIMQMPIYGLSTGCRRGKPMVIFTGLSSKQEQALELL